MKGGALSAIEPKDEKHVWEIRESLSEEELRDIARRFSDYVRSLPPLGRLREGELERIVYLYLLRLLDGKGERREIFTVLRSLGEGLSDFIASYGKLLELIREKLRKKFPPQKLSELCLSLSKYIFHDVSGLLRSAIRENFKKFISFFENNPDAVVVLDGDFRIAYVNRTLENVLKTKRNYLVGKPFLELFPEEFRPVYGLLCDACCGKKSGRLPDIVYLKSPQTGILKPFEVVFERMRFEGKDYFVLDLRDKSDEIKKEKERKKLSVLYSLISGLLKIIFEDGDKGDILKRVVERFTKAGGYSFACITRPGSDDCIVKSGKEGRYTICMRMNSDEPYVLILSKDEEFYPSEVEVISNFLEELARVVNTLSLHEKLEKISLYDPLTDLPVRNFFVGILSDLMNEARKKKEKVVVIVMDIDNFTTINSIYGQKVGDKLLREVSERLKEVVRLEDYLARVGADSFAIAFKTRELSPAINSLLSRILAKFASPALINSTEIPITFSVGVSVFPDDAENVEQLVAYATQAMFEAKNLGGNTVIFHTKKAKDLEESFMIKQKLMKALERNEFVLYYQPKVCLKTGKIVGAEALIRWRRGNQLVPPAKFIPVLEESGFLMNEVGLWVIEEASRRIKEWKKKGMDIEIAVNISPVQLRSSKFISYILRKIKDFPQSAKNLGIEITETAVMENISIVSVFIRSLAELGVKAYIDDFGTGYSSIAYLKSLPVYAIKIDVDFVKDIHEDERDYEIVKTIINLAKSLNLKTVAEGVERKEHEDILKSLGCDYAQGFYYAPPLPAEEFEKLYKNFNKM
ncbi:MAG: EAL domain-containing protein [Aquificae bacterium]|nr:EAL domain-containing protein [Aquificota bacterium]